uniref:Uncharacterized protein n=1 Tax=Tanacetum cinerariifolium TaxID=118510 RepID=A0A699GDV6_TANCI|nr:hypothetical protein [Tanacetum cinerariifolium]
MVQQWARTQFAQRCVRDELARTHHVFAVLRRCDADRPQAGFFRRAQGRFAGVDGDGVRWLHAHGMQGARERTGAGGRVETGAARDHREQAVDVRAEGVGQQRGSGSCRQVGHDADLAAVGDGVVDQRQRRRQRLRTCGGRAAWMARAFPWAATALRSARGVHATDRPALANAALQAARCSASVSNSTPSRPRKITSMLMANLAKQFADPGGAARERVARGRRHARHAAGHFAATAHAGRDHGDRAHAQGGPQHPAHGGRRSDGGIFRAHPAPVGAGRGRTGGAAGRHQRHAAHRRGHHRRASAAAVAGAVYDEAPRRAPETASGQPRGSHQHAGAARDRPGHHGHAAARAAHQRGPLRAPSDGVRGQSHAPADEEEKSHAHRHPGGQPDGARARFRHPHGRRAAAARRRPHARFRLRGVEQRGDQAHGVGRAGTGLFVGARVRAGIRIGPAGHPAHGRTRGGRRLADHAPDRPADPQGGGVVPGLRHRKGPGPGGARTGKRL